MEYCSTVWDPYTKRLTQQVEMVQRHEARWVCSEYRQGPKCAGPTEMINHLSWPRLELRRKVAWLKLLYKMTKKLFMMSIRSLLVRAPRNLRSVPPHTFMPLFHIPTRQYQTNSFFLRTVADWNELPSASAPSLTLRHSKPQWWSI